MIINIKYTVTCLLLVICSISLQAQAPAGKATTGTNYGKEITSEKAIDASELPLMLSGRDTVTVKIRTTVKEVCSKKGCWLTFRVDDNTEAFVKMKNYEFFVPLDLQGKSVVIEGKSFIRTTTVEELRHYAEDAGKSKKDIEAITEEKKEIRFIASGILVTG